MLIQRFLCGLSLILAIPSAVFAQDVSIASEHRKRIKAASEIAALSTGAFGDQTSESTGKTSFANVDVDLAGNSALPVQFARRIVIEPRHITEELGGLGNWDIDVPYIEGTFSKNLGWTIPSANVSDRVKRCSIPSIPDKPGAIFTASDFFSGYNIHVPGVLDELLLQDANTYVDPSDGAVYPWILPSMARVSCLPSLKNGYPGEGFVLKLANGTKYYFDYAVERSLPIVRKGPKTALDYSLERKRIFLLATRIEDRFGNYVDYQYVNGSLINVSANDGRQISIAYSGNQTSAQTVTASANGRSWVYSVQNGHLVSVINPDGSTWQYSAFGTYTSRDNPPEQEMPALDYFSPEAQCLSASLDEYRTSFTFSVKHPSGALAQFDFSGKEFGRSRVPYGCVIDFESHETGADQIPVSGYAHIAVANWYPALSLVKSTVNGPGLSALVTGYEYINDGYSYCDYFDSQTGAYSGPRCNEDPCQAGGCDGVGRWVVITKPSGEKVRKRFGVIYGVNEGLLLAVETLNASGAVIDKADYAYYDGSLPNNQSFGRQIGYGLTSDPMQGRQIPLISTNIQRNGASFKSEVPLCGAQIYCFDGFARQTRMLKSSSLGYSRTDITEYHDNLSLWVLGQVKRQYTLNTEPNGQVTTSAMLASDVEYNAQALPWKTYKFGKLQQTITYAVDGQPSTVTDARNNTTTLSNWKRGIPQQIRYPATAEAPGGATESAVVDDNGWISSVTNPIGAKTCYGYDTMGRLASITYPSETQSGVCDTSRWNQTTIATEFIMTPEHGIAGGHWRVARREGPNAHYNTYYDAMLRPVVEESLDLNDIAGTLRQVVKRYDNSGRLSFQSYPTNNVDNAWDVTQGVRTFYDALDRTVRVEQDSELGALATDTEYLPGLQVRTTNPRNQQTTTSFMAWDQPGYDLPILSQQPEGKTIQIGRHPQFGWPLALTQRNAANTLSQTRRYVYDGNAQLCKTIEPETGATVTGYDAAGNPAWSAAGLTGGDYANALDCSYAAANASGRVVNRIYDPRNRVSQLQFPDGRGNQIWTYTPDSLPASITTYNDPNNTTPVVNAYNYNYRRILAGESVSLPGWYTWSIGYGYNANAHLALHTYPTGLAVDYAPNNLGQPTKAGIYASGAQYYPNGALKQFTYGNGIVHTMYQNQRQLPSRSVSSAGALDIGYFYDPNANVSHIADHGRGSDYSRWMQYDGLDRLTGVGSASFGGDHWHRFTYDALDNMASWKLAGVKDYADYVYDAQNRLMSIRNTAGATVVGLAYDPQGNLNNKNGQGYDFDYGNRLRNVVGKEYYRYDGLGRRVLSWRPVGVAGPADSLSLFQYSQSGQVMYEEHSDKPNGVHVYLGGSLIATRHGDGAVKYQHTDALGSPVAVTNETGAVIERNDYEPYGAIIGKPTRSGIGYTGHVMDGATGLTYMQQRYYDQSLGRFLSVDTVTANSANGTNFNRYWYGNNNPYRFTDPDGRQSLEQGAPSTGIGVPFLDNLLKPSDVQAMDKGQMIREQLSSELSRPMSWRERITYVAIAMSAATGAVGRGAGPTVRTATAIEITPGATRASAPQIRVGATASEAREALAANGYTWKGSKNLPGAGSMTKGNTVVNFSPISKSTGLPSAKVTVDGKRTATIRFDKELPREK